MCVRIQSDVLLVLTQSPFAGNEVKISLNTLFSSSRSDHRAAESYAIRTETLENPPCSHHHTHTHHICLDVLLHQLAAINTSPLSTCVWSSGIWAALSEVCCCIIKISTGTLRTFPRALVSPQRVTVCLPAAICTVFFHHNNLHVWLSVLIITESSMDI